MKVEFAVNAQGDVVDARVLSGLGHGLSKTVLSLSATFLAVCSTSAILELDA